MWGSLNLSVKGGLVTKKLSLKATTLFHKTTTIVLGGAVYKCFTEGGFGAIFKDGFLFFSFADLLTLYDTCCHIATEN